MCCSVCVLWPPMAFVGGGVVLVDDKYVVGVAGGGVGGRP